MGFRCPKCHKDFGRDKNRFESHYKECVGISLDTIMETSINQAKIAVIESIKRQLEENLKEIMKESEI